MRVGILFVYFFPHPPSLFLVRKCNIVFPSYLNFQIRISRILVSRGWLYLLDHGNGGGCDMNFMLPTHIENGCR